MLTLALVQMKTDRLDMKAPLLRFFDMFRKEELCDLEIGIVEPRHKKRQKRRNRSRKLAKIVAFFIGEEGETQDEVGCHSDVPRAGPFELDDGAWLSPTGTSQTQRMEDECTEHFIGDSSGARRHPSIDVFSLADDLWCAPAICV